MDKMEPLLGFKQGVMQPVLGFRTCASAATVENALEGPARRLEIIWTVTAANETGREAELSWGRTRRGERRGKEWLLPWSLWREGCPAHTWILPQCLWFLTLAFRTLGE